MAATYEVRLETPQGVLLQVLKTFTRLEYGRRENDYGYMTLELVNDGTLPISYWQRDMRLSVWRTPIGMTNAYQDGETIFLLQNWTYYSENGIRMIRLEAYDALYILQGALVLLYQDTYADNSMKYILTNARGSSAAGARNISSWLSIQANTSSAPSISRDLGYRSCLSAFQELANGSAQAGTYLVFDLVSQAGSAALEFRTYTGQRGVNRGMSSGNPLIFDERLGNLANAYYTELHDEEYNVIYALGQGYDDYRYQYTADDTARSTASPFGRRELYLDSKTGTSDAAVQADANAALWANRATIRVGGKIVETPGCLYGVHWRFGDLVVAQHEGYSVDAHISAISVSVVGGEENINAQVVGEVAE